MLNRWSRIASCRPISNRPHGSAYLLGAGRLKIGRQDLILRRLLGLLFALAAVASAQRLDPVKWSLSVEPGAAPPGSKVLGRLTATIEPGWHLYSLSTPPPSRPTKFQLAQGSTFEGLKSYYQEPKRAFDKNFN